MLPSGPRINMDVKFPLANYLRFLEAESDLADAYRKAFIDDVRNRIREVTTREYIDTADGTTDFVLVFIPNEQIYGFVHETDPQLLEFAIARKVVLCSPLTLFAILAVVRQAADNFRLQQASHEILRLLGEFQKQWHKYGEVVERLGRALESSMKAYAELTGARTRQLDRQLDKIDELRRTEHELARVTAPDP
jgi:DNA recombination protein RmuC